MKDWLVREDIEKKKAEYLRSIDPYIDYIEDSSQYNAAKRWNSKFSDLVSFCNELLDNLDFLAFCLEEDGLNTKVEYRKGYFRIFLNGRYFYRKCDVVFKNCI